MRRLALTTGLAAATLLALTGCFGGTGGSGGDAGGSGGDGGSGDGGTGGTVSTADCLAGSWDLDTVDLAAQLQQYFTDNGTPISSTETSGAVGLAVDGSSMTYDSSVVYTMTADLDGGLQMVVEQKQTGSSSGNWSIDGDSVVFSDWTDGIEIDNTVTIAGSAADVPIEMPSDSGAGVPMTVTCSGDTLTTKPDASPFTSTWSRE
jgi:hypothetical protein